VREGSEADSEGAEEAVIVREETWVLAEARGMISAVEVSNRVRLAGALFSNQTHLSKRVQAGVHQLLMSL
jgi:hypothetical protein